MYLREKNDNLSEICEEKIAIIGASGFVGKHLTKTLINGGFNVVPMVRKIKNVPLDYHPFEIGDILKRKNYEGVFHGITSIVFTVARTHHLNEDGVEFDDIYKRMNCDVMLRVARSAYAQGVKRFIFLSSVKVLGEASSVNAPLKYNTEPKPEGPYGRSKLIAENMLLEFASIRDFDVVIIRPPLIYGPGVKGNLKQILRALRMRIPLPFLRISKNRRSMVSLQNLCSLITECIINPSARNQIFMVKDSKDYSTCAIVKLVARNEGIKPILFPLPQLIIHILFISLKRRNLLGRLMGDLVVDDKHTRETLSWQPSEIYQIYNNKIKRSTKNE